MVFKIEKNAVRFNDLVDFVNRKAERASDPMFVNAKNFGPKSQAKVQADERLQRKSDNKRGFITAVVIVINQAVGPRNKARNKGNGQSDLCFLQTMSFLSGWRTCSGTVGIFARHVKIN